jgi:CPA1 family monovalent cation:H+ antiporter
MVINILIIATAGLFVSAFAKRMHLPPELTLVVVMGAISFIPNLERMSIDGHILLELILPPLLFSAARNLSGHKFRKVRYPVLWLGVGLVFITAFFVALVSNVLLGFMTIPAGLILGAVVSPPDAVSSVSIGKKLGLPDRVMSILTGESLINDAAALTLFSISVALTFGGESFINHPLLLLGYTSAVGVGSGLLFGALTILMRRILQDSSIIAIFTVLVPWGIYIVTEHFHASGVLAVVVAGFVIEKASFNASHTTRLEEKSLWHSVETVMDAFVFAYIGIQIRFIFEDLNSSELDTFSTIAAGFAILAVVMLVRPVGVLFYNAVRLIWYRLQFNHLSHFVATNDRGKRHAITSKARDSLIDAPVSWREYIVLSWTGMRGVVTLAAASSVPLAFEHEAVSFQSEAFRIHIFIQVAGLIVAIGTLLIQGLTLPLVIKKVLPETTNTGHEGRVDPLEGQWGRARRIIEDSAIRVIEDEYNADPSFDKDHILDVWSTLDTVNVAKSKKDISFISGLFSEIVDHQRKDIQNAANAGEIHPDVARDFMNRLDLRATSFG